MPPSFGTHIPAGLGGQEMILFLWEASLVRVKRDRTRLRWAVGQVRASICHPESWTILINTQACFLPLGFRELD